MKINYISKRDEIELNLGNETLLLLPILFDCSSPELYSQRKLYAEIARKSGITQSPYDWKLAETKHAEMLSEQLGAKRLIWQRHFLFRIKKN